MMHHTQGLIHSTESFGSVDGPGVRFIIFLKGCPMRCQFCHNPDTWSTRGAQAMTADELLDKAERYRSYWGTQGGITVSGGEALAQIDFLLEFFREAHRRGITTCLDTSAQPFRPDDGTWMEKWTALMGDTDTVLLDIKHIDNEAHRRLTGHPNRNILACARWLSDHHVPVWIRHVLIPGITDDDCWLRQLRAFIDTLGNVERVEVLPYHTLGTYKYEQLNIDYPLRDVEPPTQERIENARKILEKRTDSAK